MENKAAHKAMSASRVLPPKFTILLMVDATELLIWVIMNTPKKLNRALIQMALRTPMHRVVTQVAMALGASVQPLTKMTPSVRSTVMSSTGLDTACCKKVSKSIITPALSYFPIKNGPARPDGGAVPYRGTCSRLTKTSTGINRGAARSPGRNSPGRASPYDRLHRLFQ